MVKAIDKDKLMEAIAWNDQVGMIMSIDDVLDIIEEFPTLKPSCEVIEMGSQASDTITKLQADLDTVRAERDNYQRWYFTTVEELKTEKLYAELYKDIADRYAKMFDKIRPRGEDNGHRQPNHPTA